MHQKNMGGLNSLTLKAIVFEEAGYSRLGPIAMNIHAPDEGNIHLMEHVATEAQKSAGSFHRYKENYVLALQ